MSLPRLRVLLALGLAGLFGQPQIASAAAVRRLALAELVARADRILVTEVVEVRSERSRQRGDGVPVTLVVVRVERALKGAGGTQTVLEFLGGRVGNDALEIPGLPRFSVGDRDVLFLHGVPATVSPLVGVMLGRFRVVTADGQPRERVAAHDGRPLTIGSVAAPLSLAAFEQALLEMVHSQGTGASPAEAAQRRRRDPPVIEGSGDDKAPEQWSSPPPDAGVPAKRSVVVTVNLGPSPALLDGCADWVCSLKSREWFAKTRVVSGQAGRAVPPGGSERVSAEWGRGVFGYALDADTLALTVRRTRADATVTRLVFNDRLAWNSFDGTGRTSPSERVLDLPGVAAQELGLLPLASASGGASGAGREPGAPGVATPATVSTSIASSRSPSPDALGDSPCSTAAALVNPRLLAFDSADHPMMSAYQVGFFLPGASSPTQVIDVPLTAFLVRRVVDLPGWAALAMQSSLVADVRSAGLATPIDAVYTYRVRGVWSGGTTAWSESSQPFVRCTTSFAADR